MHRQQARVQYERIYDLNSTDHRAFDTYKSDETSSRRARIVQMIVYFLI